ncbi:hypothetical protein [Paenibacillus thermotolerans]|uniref:hypothetical protein n=1 Tax=Paenibacillus thermotolerans TaxID=3027807 RepID=UPI00236889B8|nr:MULTISPECIES: hypothetical protein [unclassified Paenibacillus]
MVEELLAIAAAYGLGICLMHLLYGRFKREAFHIVLVTNDAGSSIEWHLRSIALMSWLRSRDTVVTVLDEGSTDDTVLIAMRLAGSSRMRSRVISAASAEEAERWLHEQSGGVDQVIRLNGAAGVAGGGGKAPGAASVS